MKSLLFSSVFVLVGFFCFSQEAIITDSEVFKKSVVDGNISMTLPSEITNDDVQKYSKYYTAFFTTAFDSKSHQVTFNMVNNEPKSRRVIIRFLSANGIQFARIGDSALPLSDFYDTYLN
jgi:hypothetical protein